MKILWLLVSLFFVAVLTESFFPSENPQELKDFMRNQMEIMAEVQTLSAKNYVLSSEVQELRAQNKLQTTEIEALREFVSSCHLKSPSGDLKQTVTIEERVTNLEIEVSELDEELDLLSATQLVQDERIYDLEQETEMLEDSVQVLQIRTISLEGSVGVLDNRLSVLEDESSVEELGLRVTQLEIVTADQEEIITANNQSIEELETADVDFEARVRALEEGSDLDTVAFSAVLTSYTTIDLGSPVVFNSEQEDTANMYNPSTGTFTAPEAGCYYLSTYLLIAEGEWGSFRLWLNGNTQMCTAVGDESDSGSDRPQATCSGIACMSQGDEVQVFYIGGADTTPLYKSSSSINSGFSGFKL